MQKALAQMSSREVVNVMLISNDSSSVHQLECLMCKMLSNMCNAENFSTSLSEFIFLTRNVLLFVLFIAWEL